MSDPLLIQRQRELLRDLAHLTAERAAAATDVEAAFKARNQAAAKEYQETIDRTQTRYDADHAAADAELQKARASVTERHQTEHAATSKEYSERRSELQRRFELEQERADQEHQEARWSVATMAEAKKREAEVPRQDAEAKISATLIRVQAIRQEARAALESYRQRGRFADTVPSAILRRPANETLIEMKKRHGDAEDGLAELRGLRLPRFFRGPRLLIVLIVLWLVLAVPLFVLYPDGLGRADVPWWVVATTGAILLEIACAGFCFVLARAQVHRAWGPLVQALADAEAAAQRARELAAKQYEMQLARLEAEDKSERGLRKVDEKYQELLATIHQRRDDGLKKAEEKYPWRLEALTKRRDAELYQAEEKHSRLIALAKQRHRHETRQAEEKQRRLLEESQKRYESDKQNGSERWQQGIAQVQTTTAAIVRETRGLFPDWSDPSWQSWLPPKTTPPAIRLGEFQVAAACGVASASSGAWWQTGAVPGFTLPALVPFPQRASVLLRTRDAGRGPAVQTLQALMARFLTALPPGKCRFTIIDPVGLGENFAAFMHLADFDEQLVGSRIWTESRHIEERLADIAAHMENVIQKYLRNQFRSIEEYNLQAGEVAEPFRVLVVANFPTNFSSDAARRLVSIASSGAGCGVFTLVSVDTRQQMPEGFNLADLEQSAAVLAWDNDRFTWKDADFGPHPLTLDAPPTGTALTRLLNTVGAAAKDANRVEVSFDFIAPPLEHYWTASTKAGIDVPLGRAGATKRQHLKLGHGTAQHVLIAGKTGSGKSTLLHALITNLALFYSPDEIELYLVDFKKGVEFKTYANHQMPHARVIAIESEREFGLSVLQRLDAELKKRGEKFRTVGAHDVAGYRQATNALMPRILLIVDEFQEFFTEDDKIAQEAALLLDRLVRQGRAFGLHVLLGSQTLGGAYTLARSTIDQMAVRIALQCSEADAHLILNKDNSAARLLARPGEAIYNDQNGLLEGNDIFQVVWLPDAKREQCLQTVRQMARQRKLAPQPQIVFEGNAPADVARNPLLGQLLRPPGSRASCHQRLAGRSHRHQGADRRRIPPPDRQQPAPPWPARRGSPRHPGHVAGESRCPARARRRRRPLLCNRQHARRRRPCRHPGENRGEAPPFGPSRHLARATSAPGRDCRGTGPPPEAARRRVASALCLPARPAPPPRPAQGRRRLRLLAQDQRGTRQPVPAVRRPVERRRRPRHAHVDLVRRPEQPEPRSGTASTARVRDARPLPDERRGFQHPDRLPRRQQARHAPGPALQRGPRPAGEVPTLRLAGRRLAGGGAAETGGKEGGGVGECVKVARSTAWLGVQFEFWRNDVAET